MSSAGEDGRLDVETGTQLVAYARAIVRASAAGEEPPPGPDLPVLEERRGVFVTLEQSGELRGCIGRPRPDEPLLEALQTAATGAASADPRFPPVDVEVVPELTVEVSVLTPPEPLEPTEPDAVVVGRDGVIVERGDRTGLLLPQVASERDWTPKQFLAETARKAGLPPDAWREESTTVRRFSAQVFAEKTPGGPVSITDYTRRGGQPTRERSTD